MATRTMAPGPVCAALRAIGPPLFSRETKEHALDRSVDDLAAYACNRRSTKVVCVLTNIGAGGAEEGTPVEFDVDLDSPPLLFLKTNAYSDFMMINTTERVAVTITRIIHQQFAASKVCHGIFATSFDLKGLKDDQ